MAYEKKGSPHTVHDDNPTLFQTESNVIDKPIPVVTKIDYSGAHEKTDPREIARVKKLDRWIMVCCYCYNCCLILTNQR